MVFYVFIAKIVTATVDFICLIASRTQQTYGWRVSVKCAGNMAKQQMHNKLFTTELIALISIPHITVINTIYT